MKQLHWRSNSGNATSVCGDSLEGFLKRQLTSAGVVVQEVPWFPFHIRRRSGCFKQEPFVAGSSPCFDLPQPYAAQCIRYTCPGDIPVPAQTTASSGSRRDARQRIPESEQALIMRLHDAPGRAPGSKLIELTSGRVALNRT